jgi:ariadne-1
MDSDGEDDILNHESDSGNETSDGEEAGVMQMDPGNGPGRSAEIDEEYQFEVLSTEQILTHMNKCIDEVNNVVQLRTTDTRILLNYFKWDKEKLYEA